MYINVLSHIINTYNLQYSMSLCVCLLYSTLPIRIILYICYYCYSIAGMVRNEYDGKSAKDMCQRTALLFRLSKELKWLSDIHKVCVVVINQVTASGFDQRDNINSRSLLGISSGGGYTNTNNTVSPALGLAWSYCVNTRIVLSRDTASMRCIGSEPLDSNDAAALDGGTVANSSISYTDTSSGTVNNVSSSSSDIPLIRPPQPSSSASSSSSSLRCLTVEFSPCIPRNSCRYEITADGVFGFTY